MTGGQTGVILAQGLKVMHVDVHGGFQGDNERILLVASLSQFDPKQTLRKLVHEHEILYASCSPSKG